MTHAATALLGALIMFAALSLLARATRITAPTPDPDDYRGADDAPDSIAPSTDNGSPPNSAAVALYAVALAKAAHADVRPSPSSETNRLLLTKPLVTLSHAEHAAVLWAACILLLQRERDDHAADTGINVGDLAERCISTAELEVLQHDTTAH